MRVFQLLATVALWSVSWAQYSSTDSYTIYTGGFPTSTAVVASSTDFDTSPTDAPTAVEAGSACASISSISRHARATAPPVVPIKVARDCLKSVPIVKDDALKLLDGMLPYLQFQSTLAFLKNPPKGYQFPPVDIFEGIQKIRENVTKDVYPGEHAFQMDLWNLITSAHDGHLSWQGDVLSAAIVYQVGWKLVSVSEDGKALPSVYVLEDIRRQSSGNETLPYTPSPVSTIDGKDIVSALKELSLDNKFQDLDALYNTNFYEIAQVPINKNRYTPPRFRYPGEANVFKFANGTERAFPNKAIVVANSFRGVVDGASFYKKFCGPTRKAPLSTSSPLTLNTTSREFAPAYPKPEVMHSKYTIGGYYLNDTGSKDVAVLSIPSFSTTGTRAGVEFQSVLEIFLANATAAGKTKLVIDLQANPGGLIDLGYEVFRQLFPNLEPYGAANYRAHSGLDVIGQAVTDRFQHLASTSAKGRTASEVRAISTADGLDAYNYLKPDGTAYSSWSELYGPQQVNNDNFTSLVRMNLSDPYQSLYGSPFINITGYGNRTDLLAKEPPFKAENIIMLTDGFCTSTCTLFAEFMKTQAKVKSYTFGGRPQKGPMQAVGGSKGAQVYSWQLLLIDVALAAGIDIFNSTGSGLEQQLQDYVSANLTGTTLENLSLYALNRTVAASGNLKNNIRSGDGSLTPLQFVYEAADCRLWYTPKMINDISEVWRVAADAAWGKGNSLCVEGSTGDPSSLSGSGSGNTGNVTISGTAPPTTTTTTTTPSSGAMVNRVTGVGVALVIVAVVVSFL